jgi:hypothetical protein
MFWFPPAGRWFGLTLLAWVFFGMDPMWMNVLGSRSAPP